MTFWTNEDEDSFHSIHESTAFAVHTFSVLKIETQMDHFDFGQFRGYDFHKSGSLFRISSMNSMKLIKVMFTPWKFNIAPENLPSQKERIVFQPSFFRGELLNFGGVE